MSLFRTGRLGSPWPIGAVWLHWRPSLAVFVRGVYESLVRCQSFEVFLPIFARFLADNRLHGGVGLQRRRIDRHSLAPQQLLFLSYFQDEGKDVFMDRQR